MQLARISFALFVLPLVSSLAPAQSWLHVEDQKLIGSDTAAFDQFGNAVAIDADTLLVGAPHAGPNERGAVYVFVRTNGAWSQQAKLTATIGTVFDFDHFGAAVALDGDLAVVGAPEAGALTGGAAYVFRRTGTTWAAEASLVWTSPENYERFGTCVAIADSTVAVGAPMRSGVWGATGAVGIFTGQGSTWTFRTRLHNAFADDDDQLGKAVDFDPIGGGQYQLVAASVTTSAVLYTGSGASWTEDDWLGGWDAYDVAVSAGIVMIGEPYSSASGRVISNVPVGGGWAYQVLQAPVPTTNNHFGRSVELDGDVLAIGEPDGDLAGTNRGAVHVYLRNGTTWSLVHSITASDSDVGDEFGFALSLAGEDLIVGQPTDTNTSGANAGAVYAIRLGSPSVSYCTAGVSGTGCVARMSSTGTPSVSLATPFTLTTSGVDGQRAGIVFYGVSGADVEPWNGSSFLCPKTPVQRTFTQSSNGTAGACDGVFTLDWNVFVASHPGSLGQPFAAGQEIHAQSWYRDPLAVKSTQLSDALAFALQP